MWVFGITKWLSEIEAAVLGCWKVEKLSTGMPSLSCWSPSHGDLKKLEFHWLMASYLWDLPSLRIVVLWCDLWSVHRTAISCCKVLSNFFPLASELYKYLVPRLLIRFSYSKLNISWVRYCHLKASLKKVKVSYLCRCC